MMASLRILLLYLLGSADGLTVMPARHLLVQRSTRSSVLQTQAAPVEEKNGVVLTLVTLCCAAHFVPLFVAQPADAIESVVATVSESVLAATPESVLAALPEKALWKKVAFGAVMLLSVSHSLLPNPFEKAPTSKGRRGAPPKMCAGEESQALPRTTGVLAALAALQPAGAMQETALDTARLLDVPAETIPEASNLQWVALAVSLFSVLPVPGMLPGDGGKKDANAAATRRSPSDTAAGAARKAKADGKRR